MLHSRGAGRWRHLGYIPREKEKEKLDCDIEAGGPEETHSKPRAPGSSGEPATPASPLDRHRLSGSGSRTDQEKPHF